MDIIALMSLWVYAFTHTFSRHLPRPGTRYLLVLVGCHSQATFRRESLWRVVSAWTQRSTHRKMNRLVWMFWQIVINMTVFLKISPFRWLIQILQLVFRASVVAVKCRTVLHVHHCVVMFWWSSGNIDCLLFTFEKKVRYWASGVNGMASFHYYWWKALIKTRLLFSSFRLYFIVSFPLS